MNRKGYCVFIDTLGEGAVPSVRECGPDDSERVYVFQTELEAQREIADFMITRLQQFFDGERDFEDAVTVEEYVTEVDVLPDGTVVDADGNIFR
jgi:sugar lactone lactonase YvrE